MTGNGSTLVSKPHQAENGYETGPANVTLANKTLEVINWLRFKLVLAFNG